MTTTSVCAATMMSPSSDSSRPFSVIVRSPVTVLIVTLLPAPVLSVPAARTSSFNVRESASIKTLPSTTLAPAIVMGPRLIRGRYKSPAAVRFGPSTVYLLVLPT